MMQKQLSNLLHTAKQEGSNLNRVVQVLCQVWMFFLGPSFSLGSRVSSHRHCDKKQLDYIDWKCFMGWSVLNETLDGWFYATKSRSTLRTLCRPAALMDTFVSSLHHLGRSEILKANKFIIDHILGTIKRSLTKLRL